MKKTPLPKGQKTVLPADKASANLDRFLADSAVKARLYHATPQSFSKFKPGGKNPLRSGPAIWMTPNKFEQPAAHNIRTIPGKPGYMYGNASGKFTPGTNVMPLHTAIKNPLHSSELTWKKDFEKFGGSPWTLEQSHINNMKSAGFDGIVYRDKSGDIAEVVAFEPTQIKSAIGNRGTYDPTNPDITKAKGGLVWNSPDWKPHPENDLLQPIGASKMVGDERLLSQDDTFSHGLSEFPSSKKSYRYLYHGEDNKPIGAMQIQTTGPRSKKAVIQNLYVAEANRRQGIASKLLDRARQDFDVKHSTDLTTAGRAFAKAKKASGGSVPSMDVMRLAIGGQGPKNWLKGSVEQVIDPMLAKEIVGNRQYLYGPELDEAIQKRIAELQQAASQPGYVGGAPKVIAHLEESLKAPDVNKAAVNQWIQRNLSNYIKKQMATHDDPIRKLAEQGITHMPPERMGYGSSQAEAVRKVHGAPRLGQSEAAQAWEDAADVAMHPHTIEEMRQGRKIGLPWVENAFEPWMREADPNTKVFRPTDSMHAHYLGFDHLVDVLKADLTEGRIRPEQLSKVSIEQAVRRAHEYDQAKKKAMQQASLKATEGMPVVKEYPNGYKWIELKMDPTLPEGWSEPQKGVYRDPEGNQTIYHPNYQKLQDALNYEGEVMGHCADTYGHDVSTGKSRIFSLRDQNNEPHITIETQPQSRPHHLTDDDFKYLSREEKNAWKAANEDYLAKHPREREDDNFYEMGHGSEYAQKAAGLVWQNDKIAQIKGKGNARPHDKYVPYAQDFVKSGKWANRGNREIENANLRDVMKTPALHDWLRKNEVQHERFMTPQEYSVHEKNFVDETNQRPDAGPKPMATGGVVNAESYFFPSKE